MQDNLINKNTFDDLSKARQILPEVRKDLETKMVLLSGPRQVGKTTLSKSITNSFEYLNFDNIDHRELIIRRRWKKDAELIVLDELHKMNKWKSYLKGIYDVNTVAKQKLLVTGSARLDIARKMGDSLAGRFYAWRLHPLCLKELMFIQPEVAAQTQLEKILITSGFPEPLFNGTEEFYKRWATTHLDVILRQDLIDLEKVTDISSIETLVALLSQRVGSIVSYESLARDLQRDATTVKRWLTMLENLFVIFKVSPWDKKIQKSLRKAGKYYFFDTARVKGDTGVKFENLVACALLKEIHFQQDKFGKKGELHYLRTLDKQELDFLVAFEDNPKILLEAKYRDSKLSPNFKYFGKYFSGVESVQLVADLETEYDSAEGTKVRKAPEWLREINFN